MDPYLENPVFWAGFHANLCGRIQTALNLSLPEGYFAEIDEYVWLQAEEEDERLLLGKPDTFVTDKNGAHSKSRKDEKVGVMVLAPPVEVTLPNAKKKKHRFVKIVGPDHATVLTVVEVLSPANKTKSGDGRKYREKRDEYLGTGTSLVEIDLLRAGERMPLGKPTPPDADYYLFVCRGGAYPQAGVWPFTIRDAIPVLPVPLKPDDADVPLDLQSCVSEIYDTNRYSMRIDYTQPTTPALRPVEAGWATDLLKKQLAKKKKK